MEISPGICKIAKYFSHSNNEIKECQLKLTIELTLRVNNRGLQTNRSQQQHEEEYFHRNPEYPDLY